MPLQPLFAHIPHTHLVHDDLVVATKTDAEHQTSITAVKEAIANAGITLNPKKYTFGASEIEFWVMRIGS